MKKKSICKKISVIASVAILLSACSKNEQNTITPAQPTYVLKSRTLTNNGIGDTTVFQNYSNDHIEFIEHISNEPANVYSGVYAKSNNVWTSVSKKNGTTVIRNGYYLLGANGYTDTLSNTSGNGTVTSTLKYYYNSDGYNTRIVMKFPTYQNDYSIYYNNGNYSYWINDFTHFTNPSLNKRDSIVYEYYPEFKYTIPYIETPLANNGKPCKNLVKKKSYYNLTTPGVNLYLTYEYQYNVDSRGFVTRETDIMYTQPGNVLYRTDVIDYTYEEQPK